MLIYIDFIQYICCFYIKISFRVWLEILEFRAKKNSFGYVYKLSNDGVTSIVYRIDVAPCFLLPLYLAIL